MSAAKRVTVAQRLKDLEQFLTPELKKKIDNMHNIEGDIVTFNDRLQSMQDGLKPEAVLAEERAEIRKMVRRVNKTHGDIFKFKAEQEELNGFLKKNLQVVQDTAKKDIQWLAEKYNAFVGEFSTKHNALDADFRDNKFIRVTSWFTYERAFWILFTALAFTAVYRA